MPYIYSQFYLASTTGIPMMRPLVFDYPEDGNTIFKDNEFLFGDGLLVAPVIDEGATSRGVYLPAGDWYNYWTNEKISGGKDVTVDAPIDRLPLFVKAGSILPTQQIVQYTNQAPVDPLTLEIFPDTQAIGQLYEDDGISFDYQQKVYSLRTISIANTATQTEITLSAPEGTYKPAKRSVVLKFVASPMKPNSVKLDKKSLDELSSISFTTEPKGWYYDADAKIFWVKFEDGFKKQVVVVK
jgi:alpha-glucosidase